MSPPQDYSSCNQDRPDHIVRAVIDPYATSAGLSTRADARLIRALSSCCASAAASPRSQARNVAIFWKRRSRLGAHDPIGIFQWQGGLEWPHQATIDQVGRSESSTGKRDPLTVDCRIDQHAGVIEDRAMQESFS